MTCSPMPTSLEEAKKEILMWRELHRSKAAQPAQPEGWKLVPVEPTEAMVYAGNKHTWPYPCVYPYKAMLAAAPSTKEGK